MTANDAINQRQMALDLVRACTIINCTPRIFALKEQMHRTLSRNAWFIIKHEVPLNRSWRGVWKHKVGILPVSDKFWSPVETRIREAQLISSLRPQLNRKVEMVQWWPCPSSENWPDEASASVNAYIFIFLILNLFSSRKINRENTYLVFSHTPSTS